MVSAYSSKPSARAIAAAVYESRPPLRSTTAGARLTRPSSTGGQMILVELHLQPGRQAIGEDPLRQRLRIEDAVDRRQQHRGALRRERRGARSRRARTRSRRGPARRTSLRRAATGGRGCSSRSGPTRRSPGHFTSTIFTTASGTRAVERCPPVSSITVRPARQQPVHQRIHVVLQQRLAARDLHERTAVALDLARPPRRATSCAPRGTRTACRTRSSAGRRP